MTASFYGFLNGKMHFEMLMDLPEMHNSRGTKDTNTLITELLYNRYEAIRLAGLTKGMIADVHKKRQISLPEDFFSNSALDGMKAAMVIYFERSGEIRLIPMMKEGGARVRLEVEKVNPALMQTMTQLFKNHDLKVLFTTGFCFEENRCIYEVYFSADGIRKKEPEIRRTIESIPGLYESEFEILEIGQEW